MCAKVFCLANIESDFRLKPFHLTSPDFTIVALVIIHPSMQWYTPTPEWESWKINRWEEEKWDGWKDAQEEKDLSHNML